MLRHSLSRLAGSATGVSLALLLICSCALPDTDAGIDDAAGRGSDTERTSDDFTLPVEDGSDSALTFSEASIEDGSLIVRLDAAYEGIEPAGEVVLLTDQGEITGRIVIHPNNDVDVIFEGVEQVSGTVVLEHVNQTEKVSIEARMGDGSFVFPDGVEVTFSRADVVIEGGDARLRYSPSAPTSTAIGLTTISNNGTTVSIKSSGATYSAQGQVLRPAIAFPIDAEPLLEDPSAVLKISEVRRMVRYEIPLFGRE